MTAKVLINGILTYRPTTMNKKRLLLLAVFTLVVAGSFWKLFYTDKRLASGPVEVPLAWLNEEQLLSFEQGTLFLREQDEIRSEFFALSPPANMFSTAKACISDDSWWLTTAQQTVSGSGTSSSLIGPISLEIEHNEGLPISVLEVMQHQKFARPVPASCLKDDESDAATTFLRSNEQYRANRSINVDGERYFLRHLKAAYEERLSIDSLSSAPYGGQLYLSDQPRGLMSLTGNTLKFTRFPTSTLIGLGQVRLRRGATLFGIEVWSRFYLFKVLVSLTKVGCLAQGKHFGSRLIWSRSMSSTCQEKRS